MRKGYTLIEIVAVFIVLAIIAGGTLVVVRGARRQGLNAAAHRIISDISYAQSLALNKREYVGIRFNIGSNSYEVYTYDIATTTETLIPNPAKLGTDFQIDLEQIYDKISIADVDCDITEINNFIIFSPDGVPGDETGTAYADDSEIRISHEAGDSITIHVEAQSGRVWK